MSMWVIQNADSFLLSRFVDHSQVGYYRFAQNLGFIVSFLPQGFRIAMRPLRKSALFQAVRDQYGTAVAKGQLLVYFCLLSMIAILAMVLGGQLIINQASPRFQQAAPLIPMTAAAMTMPALFRTINGQTFFPHKRGLVHRQRDLGGGQLRRLDGALGARDRDHRHADRRDSRLRRLVRVPVRQGPARAEPGRLPLPPRSPGRRWSQP